MTNLHTDDPYGPYGHILKIQSCIYNGCSIPEPHNCHLQTSQWLLTCKIKGWLNLLNNYCKRKVIKLGQTHIGPICLGMRFQDPIVVVTSSTYTNKYIVSKYCSLFFNSSDWALTSKPTPGLTQSKCFKCLTLIALTSILFLVLPPNKIINWD